MNVKAATLFGIEISICGVEELPLFAPHGVTHIVSIWEGALADDPGPRLRLKALFPRARPHFVFFDDVFTPYSGPYPPDRASVGNVLWFTGALKRGDYLLVHCAAGVSRSTALAFAALCHHAGAGTEVTCYEAVKGIRPEASPNPLVVEIADDLLERGGAMVAAIQE
jgi:predicted protein tyrosine phosphatase